MISETTILRRRRAAANRERLDVQFRRLACLEAANDPALAATDRSLFFDIAADLDGELLRLTRGVIVLTALIEEQRA